MGPDDFSYMWVPLLCVGGPGDSGGQADEAGSVPGGAQRLVHDIWDVYLARCCGPSRGRRDTSSRHPLSSLIQHKGAFYRLKLEDTQEKGPIVRVAFTKDTTPTGQLAVALQGKESLQSRVGPVTITGATGNSVYFNLPDVKSPLPEGRYRLSSATIEYGDPEGQRLARTFNEGPAFEINAGQTRQIELGQPVLAVRAVNGNESYQRDVKERSTFMQRTAIYLTPRIKGKAGEVYTHFWQKSS